VLDEGALMAANLDGPLFRGWRGGSFGCAHIGHVLVTFVIAWEHQHQLSHICYDDLE